MTWQMRSITLPSSKRASRFSDHQFRHVHHHMKCEDHHSNTRICNHCVRTHKLFQKEPWNEFTRPFEPFVDAIWLARTLIFTHAYNTLSHTLPWTVVRKQLCSNVTMSSPQTCDSEIIPKSVFSAAITTLLNTATTIINNTAYLSSLGTNLSHRSRVQARFGW